MPDYPERVDLVEVGPRDGFQSESRVLPTRDKKNVILGLIEAGLREIQVTSFVNPAQVPQLGDARELLAALPRRDDVIYTALTLNAKGVERALPSPADRIEISFSLSDAHSRRNTGMSSERALSEAEEMLAMCLRAGRPARISLQCAFGCALQGPIPVRLLEQALHRLCSWGPGEVVLADTSGMADPPAVEERISLLREIAPGSSHALHLHDTRGLGLVNALRALQLGITRFDTAIGGMGGCPFHPAAAGNIPTEDTAFLCSRLGAATGVDLSRLIRVTHDLEALYARELPAKIRSASLFSCGEAPSCSAGAAE